MTGMTKTFFKYIFLSHFSGGSHGDDQPLINMLHVCGQACSACHMG